MTPERIAMAMATSLLDNRPPRPVTVLDPCVGPGTFMTALTKTGKLIAEDRVLGIDIDPSMIRRAQAAQSSNDAFKFVEADFMRHDGEQVDFVIMNPPYVRQEWLNNKADYRRIVREQFDTEPPGTSNLYVYFIAKAIQQLKSGGRFSFIIYDSWKFTMYGRWLLRFLSRFATSVEMEDVGEQPFSGRLIDATIVTGAKADHSNGVVGERTAGDVTPAGYVPIRDVFRTSRGLRLKQVSFFQCKLADCDRFGGIPFLKKVSAIRGFSVAHDHPDAAILMRPGEPNGKARTELARRLTAAEKDPERNATILNWATKRPEEWMFHSQAPYAPLVFNYYLRNRPRHLHNPSRPYSDNFYGLIPTDGTNPLIWLAILNSTASVESIIKRSRNQGGGLRKIQLFEYRQVTVPDPNAMTSASVDSLAHLGHTLMKVGNVRDDLLERIDLVVNQELHNGTNDPTAHPAALTQSAVGMA